MPSKQPTDGDIIRTVRLHGLSPSGRSRDSIEVRALVDTGATVTIVSNAIAKLAGAEIIPGGQFLHGRTQKAAWMTIQLDAPGCTRSKHLVVVNDRVAATAAPRASMLLGHDYLHKHEARIDYTKHGDALSCPPRKRKRP
jgi:hypothetical protein